MSIQNQSIGAIGGARPLSSVGSKPSNAALRPGCTYPLVVPAGETITMTVPGSTFYFVESNGEVYVRPQNGVFSPFVQGTGEFVENFSSLELQNKSDADVVCQLFIGSQQFIDNRLNVVSGGTIGVKIPPTYIKPGNANIAANGTIAIPGTDGSNQRKDIIIFNLDGANNVFVQAAAVTGGVIYAEDNLPLETCATITISNPNAVALAVCWLEIYYSA